MKKLIITVTVIVALVASIALLQVGAAVYFSQAEVPLKKADLVIVFPGEKGRVKIGCQLVRDGFAENLMVTNDTSSKLRSLMRKEGVPEEISALPSGASRSTFEDAYNSAQTIKNNEFTSVILITSWYHLPRAYFLLKGLLAVTGKKVSIQCYPAQQSNDMGLAKNIQLYYDETVKLWCSSAEMLGLSPDESATA